MSTMNNLGGLLVVILISYVSAHDNGCARPIDCQDMQGKGPVIPTGVYTIYPRGNANGVPVLCDMETDGGSWTVEQRRVNGLTTFTNDWEAYENGFGELNSNFWLGNKNIHDISSQGVYELRVDMVGPLDEIKFAKYDLFATGDAGSKYKLVLGTYSGDAGDSMTTHRGMKFSTKDQDNDEWPGNCAVSFTGAWWYKACHDSNLNGLYGNIEDGKGINWRTLTTFKQSLKRVDMKIRRRV